MRILGAVFFNKSFGGKIRHIWTDLTYRLNLKKKWRMRSIGTRIFLSFLAGKNKSIKQPMAMSITLAKNFGFQ